MLAAIGVAFAFVDVWYFLRTIGTVLKIKLRRRVLLSRWKSCQEEDILKEYRIHGVVLPSDIDFQLHMNNSKYLREMDFGRVAMFQERGIYDTLVALKAKRLVVAALSIRYRRSLRLFDRFTLKTRIIYWEAEAMYIEQSFVASDGFITTVTLGKLVAKVHSESVDLFASLSEAPNAATNVLKDSILQRNAVEKKSSTSVEPQTFKSPPGAPINAWSSPERPLRFQLDLSFPDDCTDGDERDTDGTTRIQLMQMGGATPAGRRGIASPFAKASEDHSQDWSFFKKPQSAIAQLASPRRTQSPLKRSNKVAPLEAKGPGLSTADQLNTLRCKSESSLNEVIPSDEASKIGKANQIKEKQKQLQAEPVYSRVSKIKRLSHSLEDMVRSETADSVTTYPSDEQLLCDGLTEESGSTRTNPCYQSDDSKLASTHPHEYRCAMQEGEHMMYEDKCGTHEGSLTSGDKDVTCEAGYATIKENRASEQGITPLSPDPLDETASTGDPNAPRPPDKAALRSQKRHKDNGSVQLLSVRGVSDLPEGSSLYFPVGASADMVSIHYAAATGNKGALEGFLSSLPVLQDPVEMVLGSDKLCRLEGVDVGDSEGRTPLMHAAHGNHLQCVQLLVGVGASVNTTAKDDSTALHDAAYSGSAEMVALLLSLGAQGMQRDNQGRTPLHWATNNEDSRCVSMLLDKVPELHVDDRDASGMTPLMWAAYHRKPEVIKALLEKGADQFLADLDGMCAVHWAVQRHDTRALQVLINYESSKCKDHRGRTAMHLAAEQGCARATSLIKAIRPPSVDDLDNNWRTPLHWAAVCESPEVIRALLASGASQSVCDSSGRTALDYAIERGYHYCALLLSRAASSSDEPELGNYQSYLNYHQNEASTGGRALQCQEGQPIVPQELESALTRERIFYMQAICTGSWINKFTNNGKGPLHPRFFVVDPSRMLITWHGSMKSSKDIRSDVLVGVRSSASKGVVSRKDFDPLNRHKYAFTIFTRSRILDVVALCSEDFKIWLSGIQVLVHLGSMNAMKALTAAS
ncbi:hypothetical protein EMCRGX_G034017 [Ephydatia muelleri]